MYVPSSKTLSFPADYELPHLRTGFYRCLQGHLRRAVDLKPSGLILPGQVLWWRNGDPDRLTSLSAVLLRREDNSSRDLLIALQQHLAQTEVLLALTGLASPQQRVLGLLLFCGLFCSEDTPAGRQLQFPLTQKQLALLSRTCRYLVARTLHQGEREGLFSRQNRRWVFRDLSALQAQCPLQLLGNG